MSARSLVAHPILLALLLRFLFFYMNSLTRKKRNTIVDSSAYR